MKSIMALVVVGLLLFGVSAGISWMVVSEKAEVAEDVTGDEFADGADTFPPVIEMADGVEEMPVSLRPGKPLTVEVITELTESLMKKENTIISAEKRLHKEEKRIQILFEDLVREREELSAFGESVDAKVKAAREAVELLKVENEFLTEQTTELRNLENSAGASVVDAKSEEVDRQVAKIEGFFGRLPPDRAAALIREWANEGQMELSAALLSKLNDRDSVKILTSLDDGPLMAELMNVIKDGGARSSGDSKTIRR